MMWFARGIEDTITALETDLELGLSNAEAAERLERYGPNRLVQKKRKGLFAMFLDQMKNVLIFILIGAAAISVILGEISDAVIIGIVVVLNAVVGVIQEAKAEKAMEALRKLSAPRTVVRREGRNVEIASAEVVPGDIVLIDAGRFIPCDVRLVETANLRVEESALTGESVPAEKDARVLFGKEKPPLGDQRNMAFMSTVATFGRGVGAATATGMDTEIGKIAALIDAEEEGQTPLQRKLGRLGKTLGTLIIVLCVVIFAVSLLELYVKTGSVDRDRLLELFLTAVSLAVAAIPEGLAAVVTIVLALGVQRLSGEDAIVRRLPAVETLGSVSVICSDKTGTLTQNRMTVTRFFLPGGKAAEPVDRADREGMELLTAMVLCNDAALSESGPTGDPTEVALLEAGARAGLTREELERSHRRVQELPFDSDRKMMSVVSEWEGGWRIFTKGALDSLLPRCTGRETSEGIVPLDDETRKRIPDVAASLSGQALRVLAAAYRDAPVPPEDRGAPGEIPAAEIEKDLVFLGLVGMMDPPRLEVRDSIALCRQAGITPVMITGDHRETAFAIARELGIARFPDEAISGTELDGLSDGELAEKAGSLRVYARVSPEHKVRIVRAIRSSGNIVSMTGDGVNDAPSLKAADIGVAMGITGTDVAKGASDMILTDDNFRTIVSAVREGRNIYENIRKAVHFLLSCNAGELLAIFSAILLGWETPLLPIHILWVNLITDTLPALSLGMDPGSPDIMKRKPRDPSESLFSRGGIAIILNGILIGGLTLFAYRWGLSVYEGSLVHARTLAFAVLSISQLFHAFDLRNGEKSLAAIGPLGNRYLLGALFAGIALQAAVIAVPSLSRVFKVFSLSGRDWLLVAGLAVVPIIANETGKFIGRVRRRSAGPPAP